MPTKQAFCALLLSAAIVANVNAQQYHSDPTPTITRSGKQFTFTKELTAYPNYGPSGSDILYTGETWSWNYFMTPPWGTLPVSRAFFRLFLVLDDHYEMPDSLYSFSVLHNGNSLYSGPANLPHGTPFNSQFTNWTVLDYNVSLVPGLNQLTISNTSNTRATGWRDWIALDRIEMHVQVTPEPGTLVLFATGLIGIGFVVRRRRRSSSTGTTP